MVNQMICQVLTDLAPLLIITIALEQGIVQVKACSERLFYCGVILLSYYIFYTLRKIIICVSCYYCSKPTQGSYTA